MMKSIRTRLWLGGSSAALTAALLSVPAAALAQATPTAQAPAAPASADQVEEIVVTGIRASLRSAQDVKRTSLQVVDSISAQDIGTFPDKNLSESLQRVTGVQISRQDGEGRGVSIRGADPSLNRVEINGSSALSLTVGGTDRAVDFRDIPVEFVSRLEVVKSPTADMTEGGIGGTVRVITRRPFDSRKPFIAGSAQGVYSNLAKEYDPKFALIGSKLFLNDTLGVLLSGTWEKRHLNSNTARTTGWVTRAPTAAGTPGATPGRSSDVNGDGVLDWIPDIPRLMVDRRDTERKAFSGVVEWRPTDHFKMYLDGTYATATEQVNSTYLQLSGTSGLIDYANSKVGADNTVSHVETTSSTAFPIDLTYRNILGDLTRTQYATVLGGEWKGEQFTVDARLDYSNAKVQNNEINATATVFGVPRAIVDYTGGGAPKFSFPGLDTNTGQGVNRLDAVFNPRTNKADELGAQLNVQYRPDISWLTSLKAGVNGRKFSTDQVLYQRTTRLNCRGDASSAAVVAVATSCATISGIIDSTSVDNSSGFFRTGDLGYSGGVQSWNDNTLATYNAALTAAGLTNDVHGVNPNRGTAQTAGGVGSFQAFLDTWSVKEKTNSAYAQANFEFADFIVPVTGTLGVRVIDTKTTSTGFNRVQTGTATAPIVNFVSASQDGGYTKTLPSLNLRFEFIPDVLIGRATASKVMARAAPSQLALRRSVNDTNFTISLGNPDLKPFEATSYDAGLEWYINKDSFLSATYFRKEISSFVTTSVTKETLNNAEYTVTQPINGTDAVTINGLELGGQYAFSFLPAPFNGLGVLANFSYQKDQGYKGVNLITQEILPFPGLSRKSYNASVYYENDKVSLRASYNWRDHWLINAVGRDNLPEFNKAFGSLDASASYNISDNFTIFVEGVNLTDQVRVEYNAAARQSAVETYGSRYFFGVRAKF
ncbi:TonB-dependent receptor [Caulobacter sp. BE254]|uniref:TonB-dependent receptor n=1 Tax=Caulobacter sp. BE254 TaxID=2817720 RepID=UPI00286C5F7B|nr:TonB-dependent receptor [Caulobacter sp. BE254]